MNHPNLILASQSPRRQQLLEQAGLSFQVIPSDIDEGNFEFEEPITYVQKLAFAKAKHVALKHPSKWVIGADTIVSINETILGKPTSKASARAMLTHLSGAMHSVYTGYAISHYHRAYNHVNYAKTDVYFKELSDDEIKWYIETSEPYDKAGAYAIQGLGSSLIKKINGSYTNVVGLPVCEVIEHLLYHNAIQR